MPIYPTFNSIPCPWPRSRHASPNHHRPTNMLHGVMDMLRSNVFCISNLKHGPPFELSLFIFVLWLKITRFQSSMVQFSYLWENLKSARTCLRLINGFFFHLCDQSNHSKSTPRSDVKQQFTCFRSKLFCCHRCNSKSIFNNKSDTMHLLSNCKKL